MAQLSAVVDQLNTTNQNLEKVRDDLSSLVNSLSAFMTDVSASFESILSSMEAAVTPIDVIESESIKQTEAASSINTTTNNIDNSVATFNDSIENLDQTIQSQSVGGDTLVATTALTNNIEDLDESVEEQSNQNNLPAEESEGQTEEERREQSGVLGALSDTLDGIGKGLTDLGDSITDAFSAAASAAGFASLLLLFVDPELAIEILGGAIDVFVDAIETVSKVIQGDTGALLDFAKNNPFTATIASIFVLFKTISAIGTLVTTLTATAAKISGAFTALSGAFTSLGTVIAGIGLGPLIAIVIGIGAAIYSLVQAFGDALDVFKESGSFVAALKEFVISFFANLLSIIPRLLQSLGVMILEFLGFEKLAAALDSIDIVSGIKEGVSAVFDVISGIAGLILAPFKLLFNIIGGVFGGIIDVVRGIASVIEGIFTGDFGQILDGIKGIFGGLFGIITAPFEALADFVVGFIDTIVDTIKAGLKLLNPFSWFSDDEDDVQKEIDEQKNLLETRKDLTDKERASIEEEIAVKEEEKKNLENKKNLEFAEDSGLFEKNIIGKSEVDMEKIAEARTEQLEAILELEGDDITEEAKAAIGKRLSEDKGLKYETIEGPGGLEMQAVTAESIESSSTENIQELLSMGEGTLDKFTQERLEDELKLRESVSKADDQYLAASLEFSDLGERERKLVEEELALREKAKEEAETSTEEAEAGEKRGMEIPPEGSAVEAQDPLRPEIERLVEEDIRSESIQQTEKRGMEIPDSPVSIRESALKRKAEADKRRGMEIPAQGVVGVEDPLMGELKKQIEKDMAREAAFAEMREKSENEKLKLTEKSTEEKADRFESFIGTDSVAEAVIPLQPSIFTDTDSTSSADTSSMFGGDTTSGFFGGDTTSGFFGGDTSSMFGGDTSSTPVQGGMASIFDSITQGGANVLGSIGDTISNVMSYTPAGMIGGTISNIMSSDDPMTSIGDTISTVMESGIMGPFGGMISNIMSSENSPLGSIGDTVSSFFGGSDSTENIGNTMTNMLATSPLANVSNAFLSDSQTNLSQIDSPMESSIESMEYVSDLRNAQVENNELTDQAESSNVAMMSSVANNTRAVTNNSNTTVINNNGPGIDEITKAFAFNPSY